MSPLWPVAVLGLFGLTGCNNLWLDRMKVQPKYLAYAGSDFYPDGRAMRVPPAGTLSREAFVGPPEVAEGGVDGGFVERIPLPVTLELVALGQRRFDITCAACHGLLGDGVSVVAGKMALRPPPSLLSDQVRRLPDGAVFRVIGEGYGLMPPYAASIPVGERWAVVAYVRALELSQSAPLALAPAREQRRLEEATP
ncbi:MAG: c-type cytochrome [Deltaproteobacteria bacterium]